MAVYPKPLAFSARSEFLAATARVPCDSTQNYDDIQRAQFQYVAPGEESGGKQDYLLRHGISKLPMKTLTKMPG